MNEPERVSARTFSVGRAALATVLLSVLLAGTSLAIEIEPPTPCDFSDADDVLAPESCEFRVVNWNASGKDENWNLGNDQEIADFVVDHVAEFGANVITLQEVSALSLGYIEAALPGWSCYYEMFATDDHIAVCVDGVGAGFDARRLRDVDPDDLPESPPPYWWGYVQVEYEGVLITSVHTRSRWKEEHVTELHEDITTGIVAGDFNYVDAHRNPNVSEFPDAVPGPDWYQSDLDLEWTIDELERNEDGEVIAQHLSKIDHILSVEPPYDVWGDACLDGRASAPQPFFSAHRLLVGRITYREKPTLAVSITNGMQPIEVDENCSASVQYQVQASDSCCIDAADLGLDVTTSSLDGSASIGPASVDAILQTDRRNITASGRVSIPSIHSCPANVLVEASLQDCAGNPGSSTLQQTNATVALVDTRKPTAIAPPDVTVQCDSDVPPPNVGDVAAGDNCSGVTVTHVGDVDDGMTCPRTISRTYRATDDCGNFVDVVQTIVVDDTMAPQVVASDEDLFALWPPNHRYRHFSAGRFQPVVADNCDAAPTWTFSACDSSQADDGTGDGNTVDDCLLDADGSGFQARAERAGDDGLGRRYRIEIAALDACENVSASTAIGNIHVPHDRGKR